MLCVEDYIDALHWAKSIGGLDALIARADANAAVIADWVADDRWLSISWRPIRRRAPTPRSACASSIRPSPALDDDGAGRPSPRRLAALLEAEKASPTTSAQLPRCAAGPAHLVRRDGRDRRPRGADALARLGLCRRRRPRSRRRPELSPSPRGRGSMRSIGLGSCPIPRQFTPSRTCGPTLPSREGGRRTNPCPAFSFPTSFRTTAVQIFKDRGVEVDYLPDLGKDKDKLLAIIGQYDGLAIRSATKVTEKLIAAATNLKVIGRAGIGVDNVDIPAASRTRHHRDEHALRQFDHHGRACHRADVRAGPPAAGGRRLDPGRQVGEEPLHGRRDHRQDARRHRLRQHRLDRRRRAASA